MVTQLLTPVVVDQSARMPGGLLAKSLPAPSGWERGGLAIPFYGCGEPVLRDKCIEAEDVPHQRGEVGEFPAIPIEQGAMCSTSGPDTLTDQALSRFTGTSDWALSRQLQSDAIGFGSPKLDDANPTGPVAAADFTTALSGLEQDAADAGFGTVWVIHTSVRGASYLKALNLIDDNGLSPTGAKVIVGSGYTNPNGTTVRLWATGPVWASISAPEAIEGVAWRQNNLESWARGIGIVAFDPCVLVAVDVTVPARPS